MEKRVVNNTSFLLHSLPTSICFDGFIMRLKQLLNTIFFYYLNKKSCLCTASHMCKHWSKLPISPSKPLQRSISMPKICIACSWSSCCSTHTITHSLNSLSLPHSVACVCVNFRIRLMCVTIQTFVRASWFTRKSYFFFFAHFWCEFMSNWKQ